MTKPWQALLLGLAAAFHCVGAPAQTPPRDSHSHDDPALPSWDREREIASLAQNLDNVVKICGAIAVRGGSADKVVGRHERAAIDDGMLVYLDKVPDDIRALTPPDSGPYRVGKWFDPHAIIHILSFDTKPVCRAIVTDSQWLDAVRPALYAHVQVGNFWKPRELETPGGSEPRYVRSVFVGDLKRPVEPVLSITANEGEAPPGQGMMVISVAMIANGASPAPGPSTE